MCVSELLKRNYTFWVSWSASLVAGAASCRLSPLSPYRSTLASSHCVGDLQNWPRALLNPQVSPFFNTHKHTAHTHTTTRLHTHTHMSLATTLSAVGTAGPSSSSFHFYLVFFFFILTTRAHHALAERVYTLKMVSGKPICFVHS